MGMKSGWERLEIIGLGVQTSVVNPGEGDVHLSRDGLDNGRSKACWSANRLQPVEETVAVIDRLDVLLLQHEELPEEGVGRGDPCFLHLLRCRWTDTGNLGEIAGDRGAKEVRQSIRIIPGSRRVISDGGQGVLSQEEEG